jgi:hypothetical protein
LRSSSRMAEMAFTMNDLFVAIDINTEFHALQHCGSCARSVPVSAAVL